MNELPLANTCWNLAVDAHTGALSRLAHAADPHGMNWVCSSAESPWFADSNGWGLGRLAMPGSPAPLRWQRPFSVQVKGKTARVRYRVGAVEVTVTRRLRGARFDESFEFRNAGAADQPIWGMALYLPFNDNYPDARTCVTRRCNAHLWCGGNTAYACCLRMGGTGPHLGLVLTEGSVGGYSIEGRGQYSGGSNIRGAIAWNVNGVILKPGASHRIAWTCFWHDGWDDFLATARTVPAFADVRAEAYTFAAASPPTVTVSEPGAEIDPLRGKPGEQELKVYYGEGRETWLRVNVVADVATLVRRRVAFIRDRQQVQDRRSPYRGALLSYDNDLEAQFRNPNWTDQDEGRERVGMGVLLAQSLQRWRDAKTTAAVRLHHTFVRKRLQDPDGTVRNAVHDATQRLYNYPWVAQFHLELYRALGDRKVLTDCFKTLRTYYRRGGDKFYAIGIPMLDAVETFHAAGMKREAALLQKDFLRHGDRVAAVGLDFPPHEVNYEQTIVGPAVCIALECYLLSRDDKYLACARRILPALEAFSGRQPDHHLHEIAIRHWDGFWFGGKQMWGDTFPHYWSALTGWVYYRYWQATGDDSYRRRGRQVLMNNLSSFTADGRGRCVYIYPDTVNGNPGRRWDPLANDQDWALVFLMQAAALDPAFVRDCWGGTAASRRP